MKILFIPITRLGKWSTGLFLAFLVLIISFAFFVASGRRDSLSFTNGLLLTIPVFLIGISGISAFFTGIISIIKSRERAPLVFLSTTLGFFTLLFLLIEVLFTH